MSEFKNRERKQAFLFITLGLLTTLFSYQNFQYPEHIKKSSIDVDLSLNDSHAELQKTRRYMTADEADRSRFQISNRPSQKTQVIESEAPMKLQLKRAPAKSVFSKKKLKKNKFKKYKKSKSQKARIKNSEKSPKKSKKILKKPN